MHGAGKVDLIVERDMADKKTGKNAGRRELNPEKDGMMKCFYYWGREKWDYDN